VGCLSEILTPVVYELGLGAVGGFVVGFALKKIAKIFLIVIGIFVAALLYLGASDIITINFGALWSAVGGWLGGSWSSGFVACRVDCNYPVHRKLLFGFFPWV
jgi:uncharacterized membrane protein (Fun14 family)